MSQISRSGNLKGLRADTSAFPVCKQPHVGEYIEVCVQWQVKKKEKGKKRGFIERKRHIVFIQHISGLRTYENDSSGSKLNRTSCPGEKNKISASVAIKPARNAVDALSDTLSNPSCWDSPVLWHSKSLKMRMNLSSCFLFYLSWFKGLELWPLLKVYWDKEPNKPRHATISQGFWLSSWGHCCDMLNKSVCMCLTVSGHLSH